MTNALFMKDNSLVSKVEELLEEVKVRRNSDCIKFSLSFDSYRIKDSESGKAYEFPKGIVAIKYNPTYGLSKPFVEGKYSHPLLPWIGVKDQPLRFSDCQKDFPTELRIFQLLMLSRYFLQEYDGYCSGRFHRLSEKCFKKYEL